MPLIVLTAMGRNPYWARFMPEQLMREAHEGIHTLHAAIAASVPRDEHRDVAGASHLHLHHPDAACQAVRDLLDTAENAGGR